MADLEAEFRSIGLADAKAKEAAKNTKLADALHTAVVSAKKAAPGGKLSRDQGLLLYDFITKHLKLKGDPQTEHRNYVAAMVGAGKLASAAQISAALEYIKGRADKIDDAEFASECGVGVAVTAKDISAAVKKALDASKDAVFAKGSRSLGIVLKAAQDAGGAKMKWANGKEVKAEVDKQLAAFLKANGIPAGGRGGDDGGDKKGGKGGGKGGKKDGKKAESNTKAAASAPAEEDNVIGVMTTFHKPGENHKTPRYPVMPNTMSLLKEHLARTGGKVRTRFPPEPNGILHIGHAKACFVNFNYAKMMGGDCIFRYDDTNPVKEEERFYRGILDVITWLGHKPAKVTHTSDYFGRLHALAVKIIRDGNAYVCHQSKEEAKERESPYRGRSVAENLYEFENMRKGKYGEGEAVLRLKHTMEDGKKDPVAYRVIFHEHFRTGNEWCIYPTYDYSHSLIDSFEDITHSMCTKEFENHRPTYFWVCNAADVYCPVQWEYGRLELTGAITSKRKIMELVDRGHVLDWDDPRLYTLMGLRRRGFPPTAINAFCKQTGLTTSNSSKSLASLEAVVREELNATAPRRMVVFDPLPVTITNWSKAFPSSVATPNLPSPDGGSISVSASKDLLISSADYRRDPPKGYRRLTATQTVGLKYLGLVLKLAKEETDASGKVVRLHVTAEPLGKGNKPAAFVQWVSAPHSRALEVRNIANLFMSDDPSKNPKGWLADLNPDSMTLINGAADAKAFAGAKAESVFQFERIGYYCVDRDSTDAKAVFNLTVSLREDNKRED